MEAQALGRQALLPEPLTLLAMALVSQLAEFWGMWVGGAAWQLLDSRAGAPHSDSWHCRPGLRTPSTTFTQ